MWGKLPTGALASANRRKAQQKSLRRPSQAQKYTGGNVRKIYGALYAVALVERIAAFRAEFRRMRLVIVAAGGAFQLAAFAAELERAAAAWAIITGSTHGSSFFHSK